MRSRAETTAAVVGRSRSASRTAAKTALLKPPSAIRRTASLTGYAYLAARLSKTQRRGTSRVVNGTVGTALVALGARLGLAHH